MYTWSLGCNTKLIVFALSYLSLESASCFANVYLLFKTLLAKNADSKDKSDCSKTINFVLHPNYHVYNTA